jgi:hypothetical protein
MKRARREIWAKRVERWAKSGLGARQYAAATGLNANTLLYWRWQLGAGPGRAKRATPARAGFVEIVACETAPPARAETALPFEVVLASGLTVRVPTSFEVAALRRLVGALEAR